MPNGLRQNRNFQLAWFGGAVSGLGDMVSATALVLWVGAILAKGLTWAPLAVSAIVVTEMAATVVFGPIGGVYADRWDRRRTMLAADLIRAALMGALITVPLYGGHLAIGTQLGLVCAILFASASTSQFFRPARFGIMGAIVADADRERVAGITQGTDAVTAIVGPVLAAPLLISAARGIEWALAVNGVSYLVSFAAILFVRPPAATGPAAEHSSARADLRAGIRYAFGDRGLRLIMAAIVMVTLGASSINVLDLFFVTGNLHVAPKLYGLMEGAFGAGLVIGAILFTAIGGRLGSARVFCWGLVALGIGLGAYSRGTTIAYAIVVLFLLALPVTFVNAAIGPLLFRKVPPDMLGRVIGVINPVQQIASFAAISLSTWLASTVLIHLDVHALGTRFGPIDTVFLGGGVLITLTGFWALVAMRSVFVVPTPAGPDDDAPAVAGPRSAVDPADAESPAQPA